MIYIVFHCVPDADRASRNDIFGARNSIDAMFHAPTSSTADYVDVLVCGSDHGSVHLRIFECFDLGSFDVMRSFTGSTNSKIVLHAYHPLVSTHALLAVTDAGPKAELRVITLDFRFISNSGRLLALLASKSTRLQNLLRYINQIQSHILQEWKSCQDLPRKWITNINEELQEKAHCDFVTAAYHLVCTGDCSEIMKDFLIDQVGERVSLLTVLTSLLDN